MLNMFPLILGVCGHKIRKVDFKVPLLYPQVNERDKVLSVRNEVLFGSDKFWDDVVVTGKKKPRSIHFGVFIRFPATTYFPTTKGSIIGAKELDDRVRNGFGYDLFAIIAEKTGI